MEFNSSKCFVIHVTHTKSAVPSQYPVYEHVLDSVSSSKYQGVTLNDHLTWNDHIKNTVSPASKTLDFLGRKFRTKNPYFREVFYKTLVRLSCSKVEPVLSGHSKKDKNKDINDK